MSSPPGDLKKLNLLIVHFTLENVTMFLANLQSAQDNLVQELFLACLRMSSVLLLCV